MSNLKISYERNKINNLIEKIEITDLDYLIEGEDLLLEELSKELQQANQVIIQLQKFSEIESVNIAIASAKKEIAEMSGGKGGFANFMDSLKRKVSDSAKRALTLGRVGEDPLSKILAFARIIADGLEQAPNIIEASVGSLKDAVAKDKSLTEKTIREFASSIDKDEVDNLLSQLTKAFSPGSNEFSRKIGWKKMPYNIEAGSIASDVIDLKIGNFAKMLKIADVIADQADPQQVAKDISDAAQGGGGGGGAAGGGGGGKGVKKYKDVIVDIASETGVDRKSVKMVFVKLKKLNKLKENTEHSTFSIILSEIDTKRKSTIIVEDKDSDFIKSKKVYKFLDHELKKDKGTYEKISQDDDQWENFVEKLESEHPDVYKKARDIRMEQLKKIQGLINLVKKEMVCKNIKSDDIEKVIKAIPTKYLEESYNIAKTLRENYSNKKYLIAILRQQN